AEDGIRDFHVTGVQTCALPIWPRGSRHHAELTGTGLTTDSAGPDDGPDQGPYDGPNWESVPGRGPARTSPMMRRARSSDAGRRRSEERRVGKGCTRRWQAYEER